MPADVERGSAGDGVDLDQRTPRGLSLFEAVREATGIGVADLRLGIAQGVVRSELVETIACAIKKRRRIISVSPAMGFAIGYVVGKIKGDVVVTRQEIEGLMAGLLCTNSPSAGDTKLSEWVVQNADVLGIAYASELARRRGR